MWVSLTSLPPIHAFLLWFINEKLGQEGQVQSPHWIFKGTISKKIVKRSTNKIGSFCLCANAFQIFDKFLFVQFMHTPMERLDQGHLHPKLEVPGLTCPGQDQTRVSCAGGEHSRKEPSRQLDNNYSELLHMSPRHGSPQCMYYMNIHEHTWTALGCRPNSTCKADGLLPSWRLASSACFASRRGHHYGETWPRSSPS